VVRGKLSVHKDHMISQKIIKIMGKGDFY